MGESKAIKNEGTTKEQGKLDSTECIINKVDKGEEIDPESLEAELIIRALKAKKEVHRGPLPSPKVLKEYGEIDENFPKVIVDSFERQNNHRIAIERKMIDSDIKNEKLGMIFAFILALTGLLGGLILSYFGKIGAGITAFLGSLASLVGIFIFAKYQQSQELRLKDVDMLLNTPDEDEEI